MKARRYSETQIFLILQEVDSGTRVVNAARKHGVSVTTNRQFIYTRTGNGLYKRYCLVSARKEVMAW